MSDFDRLLSDPYEQFDPDGELLGALLDPFTSADLLCDNGVVRRGPMHHGVDYPCTGHAHVGGTHIRCTSAAHDSQESGPAVSTPPILAAMVEAAARARHARELSGGAWEDQPEWYRRQALDSMSEDLAAALGVCEVREDWGCRYLDLHAEGGLAAQDTTWWHPRGERQAVEEFADAQPWGFHARVIRRLSIVTPAEPVEDEGVPT